MDTITARKRLEAERSRLRELRESQSDELAQSEQDSTGELSSFDQHPGDLGTETFERERSVSVLEHLDAALEEVESALGRVEDGTYGVCVVCGRPIPDERLEVVPATRFCIEHEREVERQG